MSHFSHVVVVRNVANADAAIAAAELALEPFSENAEVQEYFSHVEAEEVDRAVAFYRQRPEYCGPDGDGPVKPFDEYVAEGDLEAWHEWQRMAVGAYCASDIEKGVYDDTLGFGYMSTYNPDSKWDWYAIGGRWNGFFKVKSTAKQDEFRLGEASWGNATPPEEFRGRADAIRFGAIDFEGARNLARERAEEVFDRLEAATKDLTPVDFQVFVKEEYAKAEIDPDGWEQFVADADGEEVKERRREFNAPLDAARERYHGHPWVVAMREAELLGWFGSPIEDYCLDQEDPRAAFIQRQLDGVFVPFSVLIDGKWVAQGDMGWFGFAANEKRVDDWASQVARLYAGLHDDVYLVNVDCHI